ncbi:MAG: hypothetical protein LBN07_00520 [Christensenellaceae bacterium]|nr:hypothetical protein [Christensenellaceae bacterium]
MLVSKKDGTTITIALNPKNFHILKNYRGLEIKNMDAAEEWMKVNFWLNKKPREERIPERAEKFRSYWWLILILSAIEIGILCVPFAFLGVWLGLDSSVMTIILVPIVLFIFMPLIFKLPCGITWINKDVV